MGPFAPPLGRLFRARTNLSTKRCPGVQLRPVDRRLFRTTSAMAFLTGLWVNTTAAQLPDKVSLAHGRIEMTASACACSAVGATSGSARPHTESQLCRIPCCAGALLPKPPRGRQLKGLRARALADPDSRPAEGRGIHTLANSSGHQTANHHQQCRGRSLMYRSSSGKGTSAPLPHK